MRIYLAGKVSRADWRTAILGARPGGVSDEDWVRPWPTLRKAIFGVHDYVGPYFVSCDHGCAHGKHAHGVLGGGCTSLNGRDIDLVAKCQRAIRTADLVFAWLDDTTAYGTLWELGFASGFGVATAVGGPLSIQRDLWFAYVATNHRVDPGLSPEAALGSAIDLVSR